MLKIIKVNAKLTGPVVGTVGTYYTYTYKYNNNKCNMYYGCVRV